MATIIENCKDGKIVSFKFKVCVGRDENKKQIFRCMTWYPDEGMTTSQKKKEAALAAATWEKDQKQQFQHDIGAPQLYRNKKASLTLSEFANNIWMPFFENDGTHRNTTLEMYRHILSRIVFFLGDMPLQKITPIQISRYFQWLRNDYHTHLNQLVSDSTIKHH